MGIESEQEKGYPFIHAILSKESPERTLDVGCGWGSYRASVRGKYFGVDITTSDYSGEPRHLDCLACARYLPFKKGSFDLAFTVSSLYLFPGPVLCLKDVYRCLRPGGKFICFDYTRKTLERLVQAFWDLEVPNHSIWTGSQLARLFRIVGFKHVKYRVPAIPGSWKSILASALGPIYRGFHDLREGWWVVEGTKPKFEL
jgi:SAM-dependent methyltransferase